MVERYKPQSAKREGGDYFPSRGHHKFVSSGCTLLDCILGGGWLLGRCSNVVGDKSVGKTLLAIEGTRNYFDKYKGKPDYREAEGAFDVPYAESIGLPEDEVNFGNKGIDTRWDTVEDIYTDLEERLKQLKRKKNGTGWYVVDSLDALTTERDQQKDLTKIGGWNTRKAVLLSDMFSQLTREIRQVNMHLMIISQIRDNIGVMFGAKYKRSGGKALDFYASQIVYLSEVEKITKTIKGVKRAVGVRVRARCTKNKVSVPHRDCEFTLRYGYGVDDLASNVRWLAEVKEHHRIDLRSAEKSAVESYIDSCERLTDEKYRAESIEVSGITKRVWEDVENRFAPRRRKYA